MSKQYTCVHCGGANDITEKPYQPAKTGIQKVLEAYKIAKGLRKDDKGWDRANFPRYSRAAASILECFGGSIEKAVAFVLMTGEGFNESQLTWNLDTVKVHAWDNGRQKMEAADDEQHGKMGAHNALEQGRTRGITQAGNLVDATIRRIEGAGQGAIELQRLGLHQRDEQQA